MNDAERMKERVRDLLRSLAAFSDRRAADSAARTVARRLVAAVFVAGQAEIRA